MPPKKQILTIQWKEIVFFTKEGQDFLSLTDLMKSVEGNQKIEKWLSNRSTVDFLWTRELMHNPNFDIDTFWEIREESWNNTFTLSVSKRTEKTKAIGIHSLMGKFWWTYAHQDIAFEFASRLSPQFKLYVYKEFQRLKEEEQRKLELWRDVKRIISKSNYRIHTDAIKENLENKTKNLGLLYASEAEMLNQALFGITSTQRANKNPKKAETGNLRDFASIEELTVLSNLEVLNAEMIKNSIPMEKRFETLKERAKEQLLVFSRLESMKQLKIKEAKHRAKLALKWWIWWKPLK